MKNKIYRSIFDLFAGKLGNQIHLKTLRDAFVTVMPLYILRFNRSFVNHTVFKDFPRGYINKIPILGNNNCANGTLSFRGMIIAVMVGYFLAKNRDFENPLAASMLSLVSLIVMMPNTVSSS